MLQFNFLFSSILKISFEMYSLTQMWKCASQCPATILVLIFLFDSIIYWMYLVLFTFSCICKDLHYGPEHSFHCWIYYMLLRRIYTRLLLLLRVFYKYKFNEGDDFFFSTFSVNFKASKDYCEFARFIYKIS